MSNNNKFCPLEQQTQSTSAAISDSDAYRELVGYAPVCIHEIDLDGRLKRMNKAGLDMMGLAIENEIVDQPYTNFVGDNNQGWIKLLLQQALNGEKISNFDFIVGEGDNERSFASNFIPMLNDSGKVVKIMGVSRETTAEFRAKKDLLELNRELESRVSDATKKIQQQLDDLIQTQAQLVDSKRLASLSSLVAGVAFEINSPLGTSITAASYQQDETIEIIKRFNRTNLTREQLSRYFEGAQASASLVVSGVQRVATVVKTFEEIAADQTLETVRSYDIKRYIQGLLASHNHLLDHNNCVVEFSAENDFEVYGVPGAFGAIFSSLILNAIEHGFKDTDGGKIVVKVVRDKERVILRVSDDGCGITESVKRNIFEAYFTTTRHKGSIGLGLHIVYNSVIKNLKGNITCRSTLDEGTAFEIIFPCRH